MAAGLLAARLGILCVGLRRILRLVRILIVLPRVIVAVTAAEKDDAARISKASLLLYFVIRGRERIYKAAGRNWTNEVRAQRRTSQVVEIERAHFCAIRGMCCAGARSTG